MIKGLRTLRVIDSKKDLFTLMNKFEQESHERSSQNRANMEKILECEKPSFLFDRRKKDVDILDDMGVSKLSAKRFFKSELLL